jgi:phosphotriesterase-related protein
MAAGAYRTGGGSAAAAEAPDTRTERLVREITLGVGATGIRAGILGEVALASGPLDPRTAGVLRATARASRRTGAAIVLGGPAPVESVARALDLLAGEGADTGRVVVGGADPLARDPAALERLLARGVMLQFDMLGRYPHVRSRSDDTEVAQAVVALVRAGHAGRILLSQDVRTKLQLASYGGTGYAFVLRQFVPYLESLGLSRAEIETLLVANPARLLALAVPR